MSHIKDSLNKASCAKGIQVLKNNQDIEKLSVFIYDCNKKGRGFLKNEFFLNYYNTVR